ncbi:hypothetical protein PWT90_06472 [Aphanocladium album]|nr:hypothetical protein PWT90_06472 [Aphanocladium album]
MLVPAISVAIALKAVNFDPNSPDAALPVLIVRTGVERLSAPIIFDSIPTSARLNECADFAGTLVAVETRLETAITFLIGLEQREAQAVAPLPDPVLVTRDLACKEVDDRFVWIARTLGWDAETKGPLYGPSPTWVKPKEYKSWPVSNQ